MILKPTLVPVLISLCFASFTSIKHSITSQIIYRTWVMQVQFEEYFSGQIFHAVAEAPKEALPHDCRPDFGTAWLTTMKFKVNNQNCMPKCLQL